MGVQKRSSRRSFIDKRVFILGVISLIMLGIINLLIGQQNDQIIGYSAPGNGITPMPLVQDLDPQTSQYRWGAPKEDRNPEYRRYLAASLKISVQGASGSGTIVYYDAAKNEAYVASCGHLWDGSRSASELQARPLACKVITWYHNSQKLNSPREYEAQVLFWSNIRGYDSSLIKFKPDWIPEYFPIASLDYPLNPGSHFHSCGCDGGREVARYDVEIVGMRGDDLITTRNSPRPGRSGGGLLSEDGYYVATCWGTSDTTGGGGIGYFTPLRSIHFVFNKNGYGWLLNVDTGLARRIPIFDPNGQKGQYPPNFVENPGNESFLIPR